MRRAVVSVLALLALSSVATGAQPPAPPAKRILLRNVRVWDGTADRPLGPGSVLVEGRLIARIAHEPLDAAGAEVIEGGGRVLIPGLIDCHQHLALVRGLGEIRNTYDWMYVGALSAAEAERMLLRGFTTVRDVGGPVVGLARAIDEGRIPGPRIYPSGAFVTQTSGHGDFRNPNDPHPHLDGIPDSMERLGWSHIADGPDDVTRAVREILRSGATQIKVMAGGGVASNFDPIESVQYTPEEMRAAVVAAENYDTYVTVHAYTAAAIRQALEAGVKCIEHGMLIDEPTMQLLAEKGAFLSPQVYIFAVRLDMPWFTEENRRKHAQVSAGLDTEMKLAQKLGVKVVFGTDMFGHLWSEQNKDLGLRSRWFSSVEILRQATSTAAELLALSRSRNPYKDGALGVIEVGAYADLLIVEGDPVADIHVLDEPERNLRLIMKDGAIYKNTLGERPAGSMGH